MTAFDKIIGYDSIKNRLIKICDMLKNKERYIALGAKPISGVLLYGEPGFGKTLVAKCFIEESDLPSFTIRHDKNDSEFISEISNTFEEAKKQAPCIVFLDDLDKFSDVNDDDHNRSTPEYSAVQSAFDNIKGTDVFVIATANNIDPLPESLLRAGRFDCKITFNVPNTKDSAEIVKHYLAGKKLASDVNLDDVSKMIAYDSCAELESIINSAAANAAFARRDCIAMSDIVSAVIQSSYNFCGNIESFSEENMRRISVHEAGHIVASEVLVPESVGFASMQCHEYDDDGVGFTHYCKNQRNTRNTIITSLAGKAATDLLFPEDCSKGCYSDFRKAYRNISDMIKGASYGIGFMEVRGYDVFSNPTAERSADYVVRAELERYMRIARELLIKNREFLEKAASALSQKGYLLHSDIQKIRKSITVINANFVSPLLDTYSGENVEVCNL